MSQQDQRRRIVIRIILRRWMSYFSKGRSSEEVGNGQQKTEISLGNLLGTVDTNLGDCRSHYVRVGIGQRNGIPMIVLRITRMRIALVPVMVSIVMIGSDMTIVMMIKFQHVHPDIVMENPRPDHKGQGGEASHQETVLTNEHSKQSRWRGSKVKDSKMPHSKRGSTTPTDFINPLQFANSPFILKHKKVADRFSMSAKKLPPFN